MTLKKPSLKILITALLIVGAVAYYFLAPKKAPNYETAIAELKDVVLEVNITGNVKPATSVDLAFEKGGRVSGVYAQVGDNVFAGQLLVSLENGDVSAQLAQAKALLDTEEARLANILEGTRPEEIAVQKVKIANAEVSVSETKIILENSIRDAFTKSDDAIRNSVDQFFTSPQSQFPQLEFTVANIQLEINIETGKSTIEGLLDTWNTELGLVGSDPFGYAKTAGDNLSQVQKLLDNIALAVNALTSSASLTQTTIDSYKSAVSTARTNINTAVTNLNTAVKNAKSASSALTLAEEELVLKESGSTQNTIDAQTATVAQASASIQNYQAQLAKTVMRSPISGVLTAQDAKKGEVAGAGTVVASVISTGDFELETFVPEVDIANIVIGNSAKVTLDAYSDDTIFTANVTTIDPAETVIEGVPTYKVMLVFTQQDSRVRSGMTANIDILTDKRTNVIAIPIRSVIRNEGPTIFVRILESDGSITETPVETGLRGSDGNIEITSGVNLGDEVIVFIPKN